ncbi:unnamed protein product, partial [Prunus brigantina]
AHFWFLAVWRAPPIEDFKKVDRIARSSSYWARWWMEDLPTWQAYYSSTPPLLCSVLSSPTPNSHNPDRSFQPKSLFNSGGSETLRKNNSKGAFEKLESEANQSGHGLDCAYASV